MILLVLENCTCALAVVGFLRSWALALLGFLRSCTGANEPRRVFVPGRRASSGPHTCVCTGIFLRSWALALLGFLRSCTGANEQRRVFVPGRRASGGPHTCVSTGISDARDHQVANWPPADTTLAYFQGT